ncbi:MAG: NUDIX hydrolase [Chlamydiae bacterium]|nr:NUDIX hydrolase [Chlamydiota bacterium]MBI3267281.1 NUDIX hydrolase [Chlamydiota bacterium]
MTETTLSEKKIYKGRILDLVVKTVRMPNGNIATREMVTHGGVIAVIPFLEDGRMVMVKQFRKTAEKVTLEIPAGRMDPGETPLQATRRELKEETGYVAKKIKKYITFYPAIGYSNEEIHLFTASALAPGETDPDEDELIEVVRLSLRQALKKIDQGEIIDSKSILGLLYVAQHRISS